VTVLCYEDDLQRQSMTKQTKKSEYLQFCRSKTDCQFRIHCLL